MSWRVRERASVSYQCGQREWWLLSGPCAPWLFIILRWQGGAGKREWTGSPFMIHHSGGLFPLLSDCNKDNCGTCLQMPANWNEQQVQKMIPLLFLLVQVSLMEGWKTKHTGHVYRHTKWHTCSIHDIVVRNKRVNRAHTCVVALLIYFHEFYLVDYQRWRVLSVCTNRRVDIRGGKKRSSPVAVRWYSADHHDHHIVNRMCHSNIDESFWKENLHEDDHFPPICSISCRHLYWNIPGATWQGRMRRFPFQTGLLCPSNHQGSLQKYISVPFVKAWRQRESGWKRAEAGRRKRCLRLPVARSLGVQWQAGFLLRSTSAFPGAEITRDCLNLQKRRCGPEATACELTN